MSIAPCAKCGESNIDTDLDCEGLWAVESRKEPWDGEYCPGCREAQPDQKPKPTYKDLVGALLACHRLALRVLDGGPFIGPNAQAIIDVASYHHGRACTHDDTADLERIKAAIRDYATQHPIDLTSSRELQADLLAIAGARHCHRKSIGSDACLLCGEDLRADVHIRGVEEAPVR